MSRRLRGGAVPFLLGVLACQLLPRFVPGAPASHFSALGGPPPHPASHDAAVLGDAATALRAARSAATPAFAYTAAAPACRAWSYPTSTNTVCAVVRSYDGHLAFMPTFLSALSHGTVPFKLFFVVTDPATDRALFADAVRGYAGDVLGCPGFADVLPVSDEEAAAVAAREVGPLLARLRCVNGTCYDRPYAFTDAALDRLFGQANDRNPHGCHWLLVTNGDNLYSTAFADQLFRWMNGGEEGAADLIGFDFVSRYWNTSWAEEAPGVVGIGPSHPRLARFRIMGIDLGAALVSVPYLLKQGLERGVPVGEGNPPLRIMSNHARRFLAGPTALEPKLKATLSDGHWMEELAGRIGEEEAVAREEKGGVKRKVIVRRTFMFHQ
ncbi:hypothetical protein DFJ74DRAFT_718280 [Hyaloraphidium curvatum]|nr:hypothetical protein DFJ74DRAFT_718280 [Hyaloraphidium curvatum]